ncbi:MAG: amino acid ABC transporter permease [Gammaproteobacteria bacterium]
MSVKPESVAAIGSAPPARPPIWNDPTYRALFFQLVVLVVLVLLATSLVNNTLANLERQGIASGFGFLERTAGFSIGESLIDYKEEDSYGRTFLVGLLNTMWVSAWGIVFATILGFIIGVARLSPNWLISKLAMVYIEILRNIPLLLQIFFWYFAVLRPLPSPRQAISVSDALFLTNRGLHFPRGVPEEGWGLVLWAFVAGVVAAIAIAIWAHKRQDRTGEQFPVLWTSLGLIIGVPVITFLVLGLPMHLEYPELKGFNFAGGSTLTPEFSSLLLALSLYTAAFIAENVRAGIQAVSHGQTEAAYALGLRAGPTLRLVIIPQALRVIIPPLTSQYLNLTKNSSLAAAIAYPDLVLVFAGTALMQTGQAVEIIVITMGVYLTLSLLISAFMNWYNAKMALVER